MSTKMITAFILVAACSSPSFSQSVGDGAARLAREARRDAREARIQTRAAPPETPEVDLMLGLAYDNGDDDSWAANLPFVINYKTVPKNETGYWKLQLSGNGYATVSVPGESRKSGMSDVSFNIFHPIVVKNLIGMLGASIPTHGDVGSDSWSETGKLIWSAQFNDDFGYTAIGRVTHYQSSAEGVSSVSQSMYGDVDYAFQRNHDFVLSLQRDYQQGVGGSSQLGVEYDFPIVERLCDGSLVLGRGISPSPRHTGIELDLTYHF
jgi:hypothetical protein